MARRSKTSHGSILLEAVHNSKHRLFVATGCDSVGHFARSCKLLAQRWIWRYFRTAGSYRQAQWTICCVVIRRHHRRSRATCYSHKSRVERTEWCFCPRWRYVSRFVIYFLFRFSVDASFTAHFRLGVGVNRGFAMLDDFGELISEVSSQHGSLMKDHRVVLEIVERHNAIATRRANDFVAFQVSTMYYGSSHIIVVSRMVRTQCVFR